MGYEAHFDNSGIVVKNCVSAVVTLSDFLRRSEQRRSREGAVDRDERKQYNQCGGNCVQRLGLGNALTLNSVHLNRNMNGISCQKKVEWRLEGARFSGCRPRCSTR